MYIHIFVIDLKKNSPNQKLVTDMKSAVASILPTATATANFTYISLCRM